MRWRCSAPALPPTAATDAKRVGDFSLLDQQGYFHQMSYYDDHKAIALLVQSSASPVSDKDLAAFKEARAKYQDKVKFFMIDPVANETRESVQQELDKHGLDIPVLMDETQLVAEGLGVSKIGEVFLMQPGTTEVLYRGPANKYLVSAIDDVLAGREVKKAKVEGARRRRQVRRSGRSQPSQDPRSPIRRTSRRSSPRTARAAIAKAASRRSR